MPKVTTKSETFLTGTLPGLITTALERPLARALGERLGMDDWRWYSSADALARSKAIAFAIREAGLGAGDRVALVSLNRVDWILADFGILLAGCVVVPIFATIASDQLAFILEDADVKLIFAENEALAKRIREVSPGIRTIVFDRDEDDSLLSFTHQGSVVRDAYPERLETFTEGITADDLAVLIYTSGTTGDPKGVMLTHRNLVSNATTSLDYVVGDMPPGEPVLSMLPFSHIYEHTMMLGGLRRGFEYAITSPEHLLRDMRTIRPRFMTFVPRMFERLLEGMLNAARQAGGVRAKLVPWALETGRLFAESRAAGRAPSLTLSASHKIAKALVLDKILPRLGMDRVACVTSGSAPLHRDVAFTYAGFGVVICEGYGLTETSPVATTNRPVDNRLGTVGKPIPHVEVRIAEDGEVQVRGPNVMRGYYHTADQPIDKDGWFSTGDIGALDAEGYLRITDRKKEIFKTSGGKYIAPSRVEAAIRRSAYISQAVVTGAGRPHPMALISPNWTLLCGELRIPAGDPADMAQRDDVAEFILKEVRDHTSDLASFEQIRLVGILPRDLSVEAGDLSPALKVRRRIVEERFADIVERAYGLK